MLRWPQRIIPCASVNKTVSLKCEDSHVRGEGVSLMEMRWCVLLHQDPYKKHKLQWLISWLVRIQLLSAWFSHSSVGSGRTFQTVMQDNAAQTSGEMGFTVVIVSFKHSLCVLSKHWHFYTDICSPFLQEFLAAWSSVRIRRFVGRGGWHGTLRAWCPCVYTWLSLSHAI